MDRFAVNSRGPACGDFHIDVSEIDVGRNEPAEMGALIASSISAGPSIDAVIPGVPNARRLAGGIHGAGERAQAPADGDGKAGVQGRSRMHGGEPAEDLDRLLWSDQDGSVRPSAAAKPSGHMPSESSAEHDVGRRTRGHLEGKRPFFAAGEIARSR